MPEQTAQSRPRRALGPSLAAVMLCLALLTGLISGATALASPKSVGSLVAADASGCGASGVASSATSNQTVVTDRAGYVALDLPELYTDTVTVSWCTGGSGDVQIVSSSQVPSVQASGFSVPGAVIKALNVLGFGFAVSPSPAPSPTIDNKTTYATTTASGLSFTGDFNLGEDLVAFVTSVLGGAIVDRLAEGLLVLIRSGELGRASALLLEGWEALTAAFGTWVADDFGLPASLAEGLADFLKNLPIETIKDEVKELAATFASLVTQAVVALNRNATVADVIDAMKQAIQQMADALDFSWVAWAPQITVTVRLVATYAVSGTAGFGITVEPATMNTTP